MLSRPRMVPHQSKSKEEGREQRSETNTIEWIQIFKKINNSKSSCFHAADAFLEVSIKLFFFVENKPMKKIS
jgi:hypothetical protein